jgi:hypothetical protein
MQRSHHILLAPEHIVMQADNDPSISLPLPRGSLFSRSTHRPVDDNDDHTREDFIAACLSEVLRLSTDWHDALKSDVPRRQSQRL